jgi:hypothetical protein
MGEGGAEKGHDPVSHHPVDHAFIVMHRFQHVIEHGIEEPLRLFRIAICYYSQRSNDIRKKDSDLFAFSFKITFRCQYSVREMLRGIVVR